MHNSAIAAVKLQEQIDEKQIEITNLQRLVDAAVEDKQQLEYALTEITHEENCSGGLSDQQIEDIGVAAAIGAGAAVEGLRAKVRASIIARDIQVPGILNY